MLTIKIDYGPYTSVFEAKEYSYNFHLGQLDYVKPEDNDAVRHYKYMQDEVVAFVMNEYGKTIDRFYGRTADQEAQAMTEEEKVKESDNDVGS